MSSEDYSFQRQRSREKKSRNHHKKEEKYSHKAVRNEEDKSKEKEKFILFQRKLGKLQNMPNKKHQEKTQKQEIVKKPKWTREESPICLNPILTVYQLKDGPTVSEEKMLKFAEKAGQLSAHRQYIQQYTFDKCRLLMSVLDLLSSSPYLCILFQNKDCSYQVKNFKKFLNGNQTAYNDAVRQIMHPYSPGERKSMRMPKNLSYQTIIQYISFLVQPQNMQKGKKHLPTFECQNCVRSESDGQLIDFARCYYCYKDKCFKQFNICPRCSNTLKQKTLPEFYFLFVIPQFQGMTIKPHTPIPTNSSHEPFGLIQRKKESYRVIKISNSSIFVIEWKKVRYLKSRTQLMELLNDDPQWTTQVVGLRMIPLNP